MSVHQSSRQPNAPARRSRSIAALASAALMAGSLLPLGVASAAQAAEASDFSTSFESNETLKPYADLVEERDGVPTQQNVAGPSGGSVLPLVTTVAASGENAPGEAAIRAADGDSGTKWLVFATTAWLKFDLSQSVQIASYTITSGDDAPARDPKNWIVQGSNDGSTWTTVDTQTNQKWADSERRTKKSYVIESGAPYSQYRLEIQANQSGNIIQLADFDLLKAVDPDAADAPMTSLVGSGPSSGYNMKARVGFTGVRSLRFGGEHSADGEAFATNRLFDVDILVGAETRLSYLIFPELTANDLQYPSTYSAVDLRFTDGSYLSELAPRDVYDISATAEGQGAGNILYPNQWNHVEIDLGTVAAGKTIEGILVAYDNPSGSDATLFQGWLDDIKVEAQPERIDASSLTNFVDTRRGTNSSSAFSRGSNEAITSVPNGFNFLVPVTDALATSREYSYQQGNDAQNRTRFEGLGISHQPSPWMGDRNQFSAMPVSGSAAPSGNPHTRALTFSHDNETAQPDYYGVTSDSGVQAEMTPTNRGMIMRFTFADADEDGSVVLDSPTGDGDFTIDASTGEVRGWIDKGAGFLAGQSRMFVYGQFDETPVSTGTAAGGRSLTEYALFSLGADKTVTLRLATSLISLDQAGTNFDQEVGDRSFESVRDEARELWNERLGVIEVEGASETELRSLYSNLYRLNVYPNAQFENTGTIESPDYKYASPVSAETGTDTATTTAAKIVSGKMYVNNGFWDTYRTTWPAYSLLYPEVAAELIDGFTEQYRDGGWIARWSSPGYANIMTGTSSDVSFADAFLRDVDLTDALATYDAAVKNASTPSSNDNVGRKSLRTSTFLGYTPASQGESVSWATEGYINDYGIGNMAAALAEDPATPESRRATLREEAEYYLDRATNYVNMFDPEIGFFQARDSDGSFVTPPDQYNPKAWWGPYTETNGWNFAFHAPQDPNGLANLYGGKAGLESKLDEFFATPETSLGPIHEEVEARDGRFGQWGVSNQVSHHIPFMYNAAGSPAKAQQIVREALQRSYTGSTIGQGYAGDEDNGEMSAWYILNALGLYPLQVGSTDLVIGSPLFDKATVHLADGEELVINTQGNSSENVYVQSLTIDGAPWTSTSIDSNVLTDGATLDFVMGAEPSEWGTAAEDAPPSLTGGDEIANPRVDTTEPLLASLSSSGGENVAALVDNTSSSVVTFATPTPQLTLAYSGAKQRPTFYTLSAGASPGDPSSWTLEGSDDGVTWTAVDTRSDVVFAHRSQTMPFKVANPGSYQRFRLSVTAGAPTISLSEIELLTDGEGAEASALTFSPASDLAATSGVERTFALGILSGGIAESYAATVEWGDGSEPTAASIDEGKVGNFPVSAAHTFEAPGVYRGAVSVTDGDASSVLPVVFTVAYLEPLSLRAAFDSVCIADDGVGANCDAKGISFPRAGLKAGGLEAGVEHGVPGTELRFTLPVVPAGMPDNATGSGQTIAVDLGEGATQLSFIGAATERNQDTIATVNFTDGTTANTPLQFSDWTKGGNSGATAPYGNIEVVKSSYRLSGGSPSNVASFFFSTVPYVVPADKIVESITLPLQPGEPGVAGRVHVFAIASDGATPPSLEFAATVGADVQGIAGEELAVPLASIVPTNADAAAPIVRVQWGDTTVTEDATLTAGESGETLAAGRHVYADAGSYTVTVTVATGARTEHVALTATIEEPEPSYQTSLVVTPEDGVVAGAEIDVAGAGFAPGESVTIELQTPIAVERTVDAGDDGRVSAKLTVGEGTEPGMYSVVATGVKSAMPATDTVTVHPPVVAPVYEPVLRSNATTGRPGDLVTIMGEGFAPGEVVTVEIHSAPITVGTVTVDRLGALQYEFAVPTGLPVGDHRIVATGEVSAVPAEIAFAVLPPATPGDGSNGVDGPSDPSVIAGLSNTGVDGGAMAFLALVAAAFAAVGLTLIVRRRRRRRSEA